MKLNLNKQDEQSKHYRDLRKKPKLFSRTKKSENYLMVLEVPFLRQRSYYSFGESEGRIDLHYFCNQIKQFLLDSATAVLVGNAQTFGLE